MKAEKPGNPAPWRDWRRGDLRYFGRPGLVNLKAPAPEDLALVQEGWTLARECWLRANTTW